MKKNDSIINSLIYVVYYVCACICAVGVDFLAVRIITGFLAVSPYIICLIRTVIYVVVPVGVIFAASYKEGYRDCDVSVPSSVISCAIATVIQFLFALLFKFNQILSGGVKFISALIVYGSDMKSLDDIANIRYRVFIPVFIALGVIYAITLIIGKKIGCEKRIKSRSELFSNSEENGTVS